MMAIGSINPLVGQKLLQGVNSRASMDAQPLEQRSGWQAACDA
jgi:hypothetical protein